MILCPEFNSKGKLLLFNGLPIRLVHGMRLLPIRKSTNLQSIFIPIPTTITHLCDIVERKAKPNCFFYRISQMMELL